MSTIRHPHPPTAFIIITMCRPPPPPAPRLPSLARADHVYACLPPHRYITPPLLISTYAPRAALARYVYSDGGGLDAAPHHTDAFFRHPSLIARQTHLSR